MAIEAMFSDAGAQFIGKGLSGIGAGLAVGLGGVGTGVAQQGIGAAAFGAIAEDRSMLGLGLVFTVLPETSIILGIVIAILVLFL